MHGLNKGQLALAEATLENPGILILIIIMCPEMTPSNTSNSLQNSYTGMWTGLEHTALDKSFC